MDAAARTVAAEATVALQSHMAKARELQQLYVQVRPTGGCFSRNIIAMMFLEL